MHQIYRRFNRVAGFLALGIALLPHCVQAADEKAAPKKDATTSAVVTGNAHIRVLQAIPNGAPADISFNGKNVVTNLEKYTPSNYFQVPAGKTRITLTSSSDHKKIWNSSRTTNPDGYYTAVLFLNEDKLSMRLVDESTAAIVEGKARTYFYNYSALPDGVRITVASKRAKAGYTQWLKLVRHNAVSAKSTPTGTFTLQLRQDEKILKEIPNFKVEAGQRLAVFILGDAANLQVKTVSAAAK